MLRTTTRLRVLLISLLVLLNASQTCKVSAALNASIGDGPADASIVAGAWHMAINGSDVTGDGSEAKPFATIQHGPDANFLYRNEGNANHWLHLKLVSAAPEQVRAGTGTNGSAISARVTVAATINGRAVQQMQVVSGQIGTYDQNSLDLKYGSGDATFMDSVTTGWPSGVVQVLTNAAVNQFLTMQAPRSIFKIYLPLTTRPVPGVETGKFNVAVVLVGPHDDSGWNQAHYDSVAYIEKNVPNTHAAYVENVPEGPEAEQVIRSLARNGFDLILTTSFGFMDPTAAVAEEFPDQTFINVSGFKTNNENFGNLFGAMEDMEYLAGMVAGSRAKTDVNPKLGYIATFPIPQVLRLGNAFALGMKKTCPECTMDVRWIFTWHDPIQERAAAESLFDAGAQVVFTGADTSAPADVAQVKGKWGITYDWVGSCKAERCLTASYWDWGKIYAKIAQGVMDKTYKPGFDYFDADSGALGTLGLMEGQQPTKGMADLPAADLYMVKDVLAKMLAGQFTRFDVFAGPIKDNKGNVVVPAGEKMVQADLDQFPPGAPGMECKYCMYWWADGVTAELPKQ